MTKGKRTAMITVGVAAMAVAASVVNQPKLNKADMHPPNVKIVKENGEEKLVNWKDAAREAGPNGKIYLFKGTYDIPTPIPDGTPR